MPSTICTLQQKSRLWPTFFQSSNVRFFWAHVNGSIGFLFLVHRSGSLYGLLLLCVFRDALLPKLVVMSGYLSHCCPPLSWKQSGHFPLTSGINTAFSSSASTLTGYFLSRDGYLGKSCKFSAGPPDHYYMPKFIEMLPHDWLIRFYAFIWEAGECNSIIIPLYTLNSLLVHHVFGSMRFIFLSLLLLLADVCSSYQQTSHHRTSPSHQRCLPPAAPAHPRCEACSCTAPGTWVGKDLIFIFGKYFFTVKYS